ncbi:MAG: YciI family protein [Burkholderiales bacterium]
MRDDYRMNDPARKAVLLARRPLQEKTMPQYLVAIHHPDDYDPSLEGESMHRDISALNKEMIAAGVRIFACGLSSATHAKVLRAQPDGKVLITDGPYLETKEHIGGLWILETANLDEALAWARKGAKACRNSMEVREILFMPAPNVATE